MNPPEDLEKVVDQKRYSVANATLIASDAYWDGSNWERQGRNQFLYKTPKGAYFIVHMSQWQGERTTLTPVTLDEAISLFESLPEQEVDFSTAFPGVEVEDA